MLYKPFRDVQNLLSGFDAYAEAYASYLQSGTIPPCLEDDVHRLQQQQRDNQIPTEDSGEQEQPGSGLNGHQEEWMLICNTRVQQSTGPEITSSQIDWTEAARHYTNLEEAPSFISRSREAPQPDQQFTTTDPQLLQGKQRLAYDAVHHHFHSTNKEPLHLIVSGTAGTGKSFLIHALRGLLQTQVRVAAPTGVAAFNVDGFTLLSLLHLPVRTEFKDLQGEQLHNLQQAFSGVKYLIIDEISMVGRKMFAKIDSRLRQAFPHKSDEAFGGCSSILVGDFGQLPPIMDLPIYSSLSRSALSDLGHTVYLRLLL